VKKFVDGFKEFLMRGNVLDLAVAVIVGTAFNAVVQSFANDVLLQFVAAIFGEPDFNNLVATVNEAQIKYGSFITALVRFVITAFAVYVAVYAFNKLQEWRREREAEERAEHAAEPTELELLREIRDLLRQQAG
jgi:large conductance mechanosensitive channel